MNYKAPQTDWFLKNNLPPPSSTSHGTDDSIREKLSDGNPRNWRLVGNQLTADTDFGELVQAIPTDYIMTGVDDKGLPVFAKIVV